MTKTLGSFKLTINEGSFTNNEIIVLLGENGCGKTTLIKMLTGNKNMVPDDLEISVIYN
jgi:ATP-binding cassette subfamily E protein 1